MEDRERRLTGTAAAAKTARGTMAEAKTVILAGGGTGGHVYPGISVALALKAACPDVRPLFLCTHRDIDATILRPTGFDFVPQPIVPPERTISGLLKFWRAWRETKDLVRQLVRKDRPAAVLGLGGYAAGVAVKYCAQHRVPAAIINPDVIPGKANLYLMKYVAAVCCQFDQTRQHVSPAQQPKLRTTGCPIRPEILNLPDKRDAARRLGLLANHLTLVVTGASQGAKTVNEAMVEVLPTLKLQGWQVLHLAGKEHVQSVSSAYVRAGVEAKVIDFTSDMADVWAVADLAVSRAGGSTCAELTACGVPSILMPYPFHQDKHQRANAKVIADAGGAVILDDEKDPKLNAAKLRPVLEGLLYDADKRRTMAEAARKLRRPDAAQAVADVLLSLMGLQPPAPAGGP